mmetsp:Transcript_125533/g.360891  ORF Transcript_125533/g.360891 Transcript_125533/m.360891 type:complete len:385 (-) Transcript_125533:65-1219(-)
MGLRDEVHERVPEVALAADVPWQEEEVVLPDGRRPQFQHILLGAVLRQPADHERRLLHLPAAAGAGPATGREVGNRRVVDRGAALRTTLQKRRPGVLDASEGLLQMIGDGGRRGRHHLSVLTPWSLSCAQRCRAGGSKPIRHVGHSRTMLWQMELRRKQGARARRGSHRPDHALAKWRGQKLAGEGADLRTRASETHVHAKVIGRMRRGSVRRVPQIAAAVQRCRRQNCGNLGQRRRRQPCCSHASRLRGRLRECRRSCLALRGAHRRRIRLVSVPQPLQLLQLLELLQLLKQVRLLQLQRADGASIGPSRFWPIGLLLELLRLPRRARQPQRLRADGGNIGPLQLLLLGLRLLLLPRLLLLLRNLHAEHKVRRWLVATTVRKF